MMGVLGHGRDLDPKTLARFARQDFSCSSSRQKKVANIHQNLEEKIGRLVDQKGCLKSCCRWGEQFHRFWQKIRGDYCEHYFRKIGPESFSP